MHHYHIFYITVIEYALVVSIFTIKFKLALFHNIFRHPIFLEFFHM